jgi:hypothetical protein
MDAFEKTVMDRIHDLLVYRRWFRQHRWADWPQERHDYEVELRALVTLARKARKLSAAAPDPLDEYKSFHDWQAAEATR